MDDCKLQKDKLEGELTDLRPNNVANPHSIVAPVEQPVQEIQTVSSCHGDFFVAVAVHAACMVVLQETRMDEWKLQKEKLERELADLRSRAVLPPVSQGPPEDTQERCNLLNEMAEIKNRQEKMVATRAEMNDLERLQAEKHALESRALASSTPPPPSTSSGSSEDVWPCRHVCSCNAGLYP